MCYLHDSHAGIQKYGSFRFFVDLLILVEVEVIWAVTQLGEVEKSPFKRLREIRKQGQWCATVINTHTGRHNISSETRYLTLTLIALFTFPLCSQPCLMIPPFWEPRDDVSYTHHKKWACVFDHTAKTKFNEKMAESRHRTDAQINSWSKRQYSTEV